MDPGEARRQSDERAERAETRRLDTSAIKKLEAEREEVRREWARRFLVPKDYTRVIMLLGLVVGVMLCGTIAGFVYTVSTMRDNQRELLCSLADTEELIVAYVKARALEAQEAQEARGQEGGPVPAPPPNPPSAAILKEFSRDARGLRARAGRRCPFPKPAVLQIERRTAPLPRLTPEP